MNIVANISVGSRVEKKSKWISHRGPRNIQKHRNDSSEFREYHLASHRRESRPANALWWNIDGWYKENVACALSYGSGIVRLDGNTGLNIRAHICACMNPAGSWDPTNVLNIVRVSRKRWEENTLALVADFTHVKTNMRIINKMWNIWCLL